VRLQCLRVVSFAGLLGGFTVLGCSGHGQPCSRAHRSTTRCPLSAASRQVNTVVLPRPLQHRQVPAQSGEITRFLAPGATVLPRPPQHHPEWQHARESILQAVGRPRPLQHRQVPARSNLATRPRVPRGVVNPRPLQNLQVSAPNGVCTRPRVPRAELLPRPLQHLQVPAPNGECSRH